MLRKGLTELIEARRKSGRVSVDDLSRIPNLLVPSFELPDGDWLPLTGRTLESDVVPVLAFFDQVPIRILTSIPWQLVEHQTCGTGNRHPVFVAVALQVHQPIRDAFVEIARKYAGSNLGCYRPPLSAYVEYRDLLVQLGFDCNDSYHYLQEGLYPVDVGVSDHHGTGIEKIVTGPEGLAKLMFNKWHTATICFLAENSD